MEKSEGQDATSIIILALAPCSDMFGTPRVYLPPGQWASPRTIMNSLKCSLVSITNNTVIQRQLE